MFEGHYVSWRNSRFNGLFKYVSKDFFHGKTVLEVGAGQGHNGNELAKLGSRVVCTEVRDEHIRNGKLLHPHLTFKKFDCNSQSISKVYDMILHWGVLYHIENVSSHLENVLDKCSYLLLETEVVDSTNHVCPLVKEGDGYDQAFHKVGSRPSASLIEDILVRKGFQYKMIVDPILNSGFHRYDWVPQHNGHYEDGLRRFWICWKATKDSPLSSSS